MDGVNSTDVVLSEEHTVCDPVLGLPRVVVDVDRLPEACDTMHMGKLTPPDMLVPATPSPSLNVDTDILAYFTHPAFPSTNTEYGRLQMRAVWYDELDRPNRWVDFGNCEFPSGIQNTQYTPGLTYPSGTTDRR
jgi:hypothetical protein